MGLILKPNGRIMIESITDMKNYIKVIYNGKEFRRFNEKVWECKFLSDDFEQMLCPIFIETFYKRFLKEEEGKEAC